MQILLTEEEYNKLKNAERIAMAKIEQTLQDLCTKVADHMPIKVPWAPNAEAKPWGCIRSVKAGGERYCDNCPVIDLCPFYDKPLSQ